MFRVLIGVIGVECNASSNFETPLDGKEHPVWVYNPSNQEYRIYDFNIRTLLALLDQGIKMFDTPKLSVPSVLKLSLNFITHSKPVIKISQEEIEEQELHLTLAMDRFKRGYPSIAKGTFARLINDKRTHSDIKIKAQKYLKLCSND